jgi:hypothetical protein
MVTVQDATFEFPNIFNTLCFFNGNKLSTKQINSVCVACDLVTQPIIGKILQLILIFVSNATEISRDVSELRYSFRGLKKWICRKRLSRIKRNQR